ncbi:hypothetical protein PROFUN_05318 [Planoprotostelium fungivorum]|uniref:Clu domain-containing protein n=1 Tax=Planoprotostelium fungivorum TaxID=1890364 RepID=A0A2P6NR06_9EUKA|nr:hypothetical protein PROFUN_05318 [Planoprotostelium fungivorum]
MTIYIYTEDEEGLGHNDRPNVAQGEPVLRDLNLVLNYVDQWNDLDPISTEPSVDDLNHSDILKDNKIFTDRYHAIFNESQSYLLRGISQRIYTEGHFAPDVDDDESKQVDLQETSSSSISDDVKRTEYTANYDEEIDVDDDDGIEVTDEIQISTDPNPNMREKLNKNRRDRRISTGPTGMRFRDWNEEYQRYYNQFVGALQTGEKYMMGMLRQGEVMRGMHCVAQEFADTASIYAKIIVSEFELPLHEKTIKPIDIGGAAGGTKYRVQNILFKFAFDALVTRDPDLWMYGGDQPDHRAAIKAAKNELKGLEAHSSRYVEGLHYPMMALVDYKGYRVIALAILPIDKGTLRYGSDDGGMNVHAEDEELNEKMELAGKRLGLCGHVTGTRQKKVIYGPGDIEGHRGHDGRLYVVDFGRVLPPEYPKLRVFPNNRSVFSELIRSELLVTSRIPLCSDAFTRWSSHDDPIERKRLNDDVARVSMAARGHRIDLLLQRILSRQNVFARFATDAIDDELLSVLDRLGSAIHALGLNYRHIGVIYAKCNEPCVRTVLLSIAAARCAKSELRDIMRSKMKEIKTPSDELTKFLNVVAGKSKLSKNYWRRDLCRQLEMWFQFSFTRDEIDNFDLEDMANVRLVLSLLIRLSHIHVAEEARKTITKPLSPGSRFSFSFVPSDIRGNDVYCRHRSDIYFSAGSQAVRRVKRRIEKAVAGDSGRVHDDSTKRDIQYAIDRLTRATESNPICPLYHMALSVAFSEKAMLLGRLSPTEYQWCFINVSRCLQAWKDFPPALGVLVRLLDNYARECGRRGQLKKRDKIEEEAKKLGSRLSKLGEWKLYGISQVFRDE